MATAVCTVAKVLSAYLNNNNDDNTHLVLQEITGVLTTEGCRHLELLLSNAREEEQLVFMQIR